MKFLRKETQSECIQWDGTIDSATAIEKAVSGVPQFRVEFQDNNMQVYIGDYLVTTGRRGDWMVLDPGEPPRIVINGVFQRNYMKAPEGMAKRVTVTLYDNPVQVLVNHDGMTAAQAANMLQMAAEDLYTEVDFLKAGSDS